MCCVAHTPPLCSEHETPAPQQKQQVQRNSLHAMWLGPHLVREQIPRRRLGDLVASGMQAVELVGYPLHSSARVQCKPRATLPSKRVTCTHACNRRSAAYQSLALCNLCNGRVVSTQHVRAVAKRVHPWEHVACVGIERFEGSAGLVHVDVSAARAGMFELAVGPSYPAASEHAQLWVDSQALRRCLGKRFVVQQR